MKAMILAAGRGERLRPLTDTTPKPLLRAGGRPLIVWHLQRLAAAGWREVVINHAHLGQQIVATLGDGAEFGLSISYSPEPQGALETAGGIAAALPLLGADPFLAINGDIWCDWDVGRARQLVESGHPRQRGAHLVLVDNPPHHPRGDFQLTGKEVLAANPSTDEDTLTYSGIGVFWPEFFAGVAPGVVMKLRPLLDIGVHRRLVSGERHAGRWVDVGTSERLALLDLELGRRE
ncbi:N-acetylmuramate alpha-1-phosphate uridylyltransferase MurU [Accumulibacter sp.]|uniref:N-acetylmuramate alpha-1-phosphate uridylyltransferase MurU n=1 Tax=Accumulibacter sp. TaxID=2053492 RepID=UPI0025F2B084|nr:nucleotidyltransferase family protein [Accumulibacter sp.]MCM8613058.1 nucleotidyltransferase family protein [Accumulibacter sp.]MCM8636742.1 nucleotidyltransferase family protein [Accumulibacter sp.]MCM8640393.1 nucleotidyltransferase family protein [Accumulibacter sp.]